MILSEREAIMDEAIHQVQPGSTVTAVVRNLVPYGAFVSIKDPETGDLSGGHVSLAFCRHPSAEQCSKLHCCQTQLASGKHRHVAEVLSCTPQYAQNRNAQERRHALAPALGLLVMCHPQQCVTCIKIVQAMLLELQICYCTLTWV